MTSCCELFENRSDKETPPTDEERYKGLLAYVVTNAISGEIMAVENYSEMVPLIDDVDEKIRTCQQAFDETKHILQLSKLGERVGFPTLRAIVEPQWKAIRTSFSAAVRERDLVSCYLMQDLMTETLAIVLYETLVEGASEEATRGTASNILRDELEHLDLGISRVRGMLAADRRHVHERLIWSHNQVMPHLFSMISYSCRSLCGDLDVACGILTLESLKTDLDGIRARATEAYVETLERCEFDPGVTMPLVANLVD